MIQQPKTNVYQWCAYAASMLAVTMLALCELLRGKPLEWQLAYILVFCVFAVITCLCYVRGEEIYAAQWDTYSEEYMKEFQQL